MWGTSLCFLIVGVTLGLGLISLSVETLEWRGWVSWSKQALPTETRGGKRQAVDFLFDKQLRLNYLKRALRKPSLREQWKRLMKKGLWKGALTQDDYWIGTLQLTVKQEQKNGGYKIGKTYSFHNFPLTSWAMMKAALGRDGTGAGTVYWQTYIRGLRAGKELTDRLNR